MDMTFAITSWKPPLMWASQMDSPVGPPLASEWSVESRGGGKCIVRIVQSLFASTDDWDNQLEAGSAAWVGFLRILKIYLTHFRGQRSTAMKLMASVAGTDGDAWEMATQALGLNGVKVGQRWSSPAGVPAFGGVVEYYSENPFDALLRVDKPGPGVAALGTFNCGGPSIVALAFHLYGDQAPGTVARETPMWEAWFQRRFPPGPAAADGN